MLQRKMFETIHIGNDIVIKVTRIERGSVRLAIDAPRETRIVRGELLAEPVSADTPSKESESLDPTDGSNGRGARRNAIGVTD